MAKIKINVFKIVIEGNSGNCSINKDEKEYLENEIAKILQNRNIDNFKIIFYN